MILRSVYKRYHVESSQNARTMSQLQSVFGRGCTHHRSAAYRNSTRTCPAAFRSLQRPSRRQLSGMCSPVWLFDLAGHCTAGQVWGVCSVRHWFMLSAGGLSWLKPSQFVTVACTTCSSLPHPPLSSVTCLVVAALLAVASGGSGVCAMGVVRRQLSCHTYKVPNSWNVNVPMPIRVALSLCPFVLPSHSIPPQHHLPCRCCNVPAVLLLQ